MTCPLCNEPVCTLKTTSGKDVLVDLDGVKPTDRYFNQRQHTIHERSCSPPKPTKKPRPPEAIYYSPGMKPLIEARKRGYFAGFKGFTADQNDGHSDAAREFWDQGYRLGLFDRSH